MKKSPTSWRVATFVAASLLSGLPCAAAEAPAPPAKVELFPLSQVHLLDGPFRHAQELNRQYLLAHDINRLLAPFRIEAGLEPKAPKYPNWESSGLDGHTAGHYLTALAQLWADTGDAEMKRRLDVMVAELAECQQAGGDGYVGGIPRGRKLWNDIGAGRVNFQNFSLNGAWVPWYNEHKLFAGLRDAYRIAGNQQAREVLVRLADWCDRLLAPLSDEQVQAMLGTEHGGMNEVLADVSAITGDRKYLRLAQRFSHRAILDPLLAHQDKLTGLHANTQIPKVIGFARIAELGGDPQWRDAAAFFWDTVVQHRSVAFGGNSEREHFNPPDDFSSLLESREGPETCNTYNMLRLTEALFRTDPVARYADYYERALFNHILSSQHPGHGGFVYFTPLRPQHYRIYSKPEVSFWCCVGSGMESQGKQGAFIYAHTPDALYVNLFIASALDWSERGLRVRQETDFPNVAATRLVVTTTRPQSLTIFVRYPAWVAPDALQVRINGAPQQISATPGSYVALTREWRDGDRIEVDLPMHTTVERLPDGSDYVAFLRGPIVLAAPTGTEQLDGLIQTQPTRMGHISPGAYLPLDEAPMLVGDPAQIAAQLAPVSGQPLTFSASEVIRPDKFRDLKLVPFNRLHDARYMMYWRTVSAAEYPAVKAELEASERARLELEANTLDQVSPGEQQPEVEHGLRAERSGVGQLNGRRWRDAIGWFEYRLQAPAGQPAALRVTYAADEKGRQFSILVNGHPLAEVNSTGGKRDRFLDVTYPLPAGAADAAGAVIVRFEAKAGSRTASVFDVRLVRLENAAP